MREHVALPSPPGRVALWRLAAILLTSLSMGAAPSHFLEMSAKMGFEGVIAGHPAFWT